MNLSEPEILQALMIQEDAGLEIHHIELVPARSP